VLQERGVAALLETVTAAHGLLPRLLRIVDGERLVTDLRHIGEVLHDAALEGQLGLTALLGWLRRRIDEAGGEADQERTRRLDTDAAAVQVVTVHASKGLEFPVVLVPFGWTASDFTPEIPAFHDGHQRCKDVSGGGSTGFQEHVRAHKAEEAGEELRLLYVALTRAQAELVLWWAPSWGTGKAPLHRLLFAPDPAVEVPKSLKPKEDAAALVVLQSRADGSGGGLAVEVVAPVTLTRWAPAAPAVGALAAAVFDRSLDLGWRRTSYTALTSQAHEEHGVASEPEQEQKDDEADLVVEPPDSDAALRDVPSPLLFPGGAAFGTLVHGMLEVVDPTRADLAAALAEVAPRTAPEGLADALVPALQTPLGPLTGGRALSGIPVTDRLAELDFELPLVGGDDPNGALSVRDLAPLLARHLPAGSVLAAYPAALARLDDVPLRGYLAGSIDAVLRVDGRYVVVDYKTNRLAAYDEELTLWHYRPAALEAAMIAAHYPLQALLYCAALHRYLRWRLPAYDPSTHLGGVLYLFLRGMVPGVLGADGSVPGVFGWQPPAALVVELSDLLARGRS
jgi:exodeoxyribonuclease V beta subunit